MMIRTLVETRVARLSHWLRTRSERQLRNLLIGLGVAVVALIGLLVVIYLRDRYVAPVTNLGAVDQRVASLEQQIREKPSDPALRLALGEAYYSMRRYAQANAQCTEALKLTPDDQHALTLRGLTSVQLGQNDLALTDFKRVVELNRDNPTAKADARLELVYYYLGVIYNQTKQFADAESALQQAIEINKADADAWYQLGLANQGTGNQAEAIAAFQQVVRFVPDYIEAYQGLEKSYLAQNQAPLADYAKAMALFGSGHYQQAAAALETLIDQHADVLEAYLGLGLAYEKLGARDKAITALEHYTTARPDDVAAQQALMRIRRGTTQ